MLHENSSPLAEKNNGEKSVDLSVSNQDLRNLRRMSIEGKSAERVKNNIIEITDLQKQHVWAVLCSHVPQNGDPTRAEVRDFRIAQGIASTLSNSPKGNDENTWKKRINWVESADDFRQLMLLLQIPEEDFRDDRTSNEILQKIKRAVRATRRFNNSWQWILECLDGHLPFEGIHSAEHARKILDEEIVRMRNTPEWVTHDPKAPISEDEYDAIAQPEHYKNNITVRLVSKFLKEERAKIERLLSLVNKLKVRAKEAPADVVESVRATMKERIEQERMQVWDALCAHVPQAEPRGRAKRKHEQTIQSINALASDLIDKDSMSWNERTAWCEDPSDFLHFFKSIGMPDDAWKTSTWMIKQSSLPKEKGGIGQHLGSLAQALTHRFGSYAKFVAWMEGKEEEEQQLDENAEVIMGNKICIGVTSYSLKHKGMNWQGLNEAVVEAGLPIIGYAWSDKRRVPVYEKAEVEKLLYVQQRLKGHWLDEETAEVTMNDKLCIGLNLYASLHEGLNHQTLKKEVADAKLPVIGYAFSTRRRVPVYEKAAVEQIPYVLSCQKLPELDNATAEATVKGKVCIGVSRYVHINPKMMRLQGAIDEAKLPIIGYAMSTGKKVAVYEKKAVEALPYVMQRKDLGELDMGTAEATVNDKVCIGVTRYALIHQEKGMYQSPLQRAIDEGKLPIVGYALVGKKKVVPVYEKSLVEELRYVRERLSPEDCPSVDEIILDFETPAELIALFRRHGIKGDEWRTRNGIRDLEEFVDEDGMTKNGLIKGIKNRFGDWRRFVACMDELLPMGEIRSERQAKQLLRDEIMRLKAAGEWKLGDENEVSQKDYDEFARKEYYEKNIVVRVVADFLRERAKAKKKSSRSS